VSIGPGLPGATLEAYADGFVCGQVGTITVTIDDGDGNNIVGPTTANIVEVECAGDTATYRYLGVFPPDPAESPYVINWEGENLSGDLVVASEEIFVSTEAPEVAPTFGPCTAWITADDVADCCDSFEGGTDTAELEPWVGPAVEALFVMSGGRFPGLCGPITERPCGSCGSCGVQRWRYTDGSIGIVPTWAGTGWSWPAGHSGCSCGCVPEVWLGRSDIQGIAQVKIDGAVVPPSSYRLDRRSYLVRTDGDQWPACQAIALDDSEEGTFSVSFWYGEEPTDLAVAAASALACQLWAACNNAGRCKLPKGTQSVVRGGTVIQLGALLAESLKIGSTGILAIDTFVSAYGGDDGGTSTVWSPDLPSPRRVG
jgi:hypothetical protein